MEGRVTDCHASAAALARNDTGGGGRPDMRREVGVRANRPARGRFNSGPPRQRVRVNGGRPAGSQPAQLPTPASEEPGFVPFPRFA